MRPFNPVEVPFILRANEHSEAQLECRRRDSEVVGGDDLSFGNEFPLWVEGNLSR